MYLKSWRIKWISLPCGHVQKLGLILFSDFLSGLKGTVGVIDSESIIISLVI